MIEVKAVRITSGRNISVTPLADGLPREQGDHVRVLLCERHSRVSVPAGMTGLWCPLSSGIWVEALGSRFFVKRGSVYTSDPDYTHEINVPMRGMSIAVLARHSVWAQLTSSCSESIGSLPVVFPANHVMPVGSRLALLQLVRRLLDRADTTDSRASEHFGQMMMQMQQCFLPLLQRCPGSSVARRSQIFLRLQRARHLIQTSPSRGIDITTLGKLTNYSANQLIRLFRLVFGETPYASLLRVRVEYAQRLIRDTEMDISEVSRISGFENRTSFSRAFKIHSGGTASEFRTSLRQ
ncbi:AraC family transcriptional regulator [Pseudolysobacter antarcticus]|uniref:AraC family transcriptional regulator n=1 Tax=Pseudolysobacter antarcticus TaxID=2511995 RepID=A0A411HHY8_9GAMM|nr:AraC family transcriptional regulator [Pseudolysobacter antarcticus]QBB70125.1 AraC family transcriptional regulator [Pseudolysobacter antarcticus]